MPLFKRDHTRLICDVGEIAGLFHDAPSMEDFLQKITSMVTRHMACEVCSIYLYYDDKEELVLKATQGLSASSVNNVRMKLGEGLTGLSLKEKRPICEGQAKNNPNFRFFPGIGEERFESFLAVPILRGSTEIGVMVVQSEKQNYFSPEDIQVFRAITAQLATTVETAKLLITLNEKKEKPKPQATGDLKFIKGRSGAEGVALAHTVVIDESLTDLHIFLAGEKSNDSEADFYRAVEQTIRQLEELQNDIEAALFDVAALIFTAQILMLKDKGFVDAIARTIKSGAGATEAIVTVVNSYVGKFSLIQDAYLRDKIYDVKDVGRRLLENLTGKAYQHSEYEDKIVIARELLPSDALKLFSQRVKGIILLSGGATSHVAILSRSLNMPLVIAEEPRLLALPADAEVLMDALMGYIHINPTDEIKAKVLAREELSHNIEGLKKLVNDKPCTKDGTAVKLMANINLLGDLKAANEFKAQGIGLYRTEFPFMIRNNFPSEEEQYLIYRRLVEGMKDKEITIRTLDIGGDKVLSYFDYDKEQNPFLGLRSIRFSLRHPDVFVTQLRAILRAAVGARVRILFPMISSMDEFLQAKAIVKECIADLHRQEQEAIEDPAIGVMVELPAAVEIIDDLAQAADFLSVGTNDLVQYMLAVDRTNQKVADMYLSHHPAVLRALKKIAEAGRRHGKDVSICGDMAHEVKYLPLLLGLGIRVLSVDSRYLPRLHEQLSQLTLVDCEALTAKILKESQISCITQLLEQG